MNGSTSRLLKYRFYTPRLRQFRGTYPLTHAKKIACSAFCEVSIFRESPQKRYFSSLLGRNLGRDLSPSLVCL
jgi:hypothetical protein